jgi:trypsin
MSTRSVLTAAHCVTDKTGQPAAPDLVVLNDLDNSAVGNSEVLQTVARVIVHPSYHVDAGFYDMALLLLLLLLSKSVTIQPVKLGTAGGGNGGTMVTLAGFGDNIESPDQGLGAATSSASATRSFFPQDLPGHVLLHEVTLPTVSDAACAKYYGQTVVPEMMLCAGTIKGGKDSCQGDSGAPLLLAGTNVQVGIVSFGDGCARPGVPGVYSRIAFFGDLLKRAGVTVAAAQNTPDTQDNTRVSIIAIAVGAVVALGLIVGLAVFIIRRRHQQLPPQSSTLQTYKGAGGQLGGPELYRRGRARLRHRHRRTAGRANSRDAAVVEPRAPIGNLRARTATSVLQQQTRNAALAVPTVTTASEVRARHMSRKQEDFFLFSFSLYSDR